MIYWITGLPGSGKTTLARILQEDLISEGRSTVLLDGDELRKCFLNHFGYSRSERVLLGNIYINLAELFNRQKIDVIVSTVSMYSEIYTRLETEKKSNEIKVIWLNASKELLDSRNQKNLRNLNTINSPGINLEINYPINYDLIFSGQEDKQTYLKLIKENLDSE